MVRRQHGHRHRLHPPPQPPLERLLAAHHLLHLLRPQHPPLHHLLHHLPTTIHHLPGDLVRHDFSPSTISLPGLFPHGLCKYVFFLNPLTCLNFKIITTNTRNPSNHQHDDLLLRPMGPLARLPRLGLLVDRRPRLIRNRNLHALHRHAPPPPRPQRDHGRAPPAHRPGRRRRSHGRDRR